MLTQKQLEVFRTVMATRSVSGAANRMHLSQPSVSRILGDLERAFGAPLFLRRSKGVVPTPEAEAFLEEVARSFAALTNLGEVAAQITRGERGVLSVATITAASLELVPKTLAQMRVAEKNIAVAWQIKSSNWVIDVARSGVLRTGFANLLHMPSGMHILHEDAAPHMCWLPDNHPLVHKTGPLFMKDLSPFPLVGLLGHVSDELARRNIGANSSSPLGAETSIAALTMSRACGGIPIIDIFTAHFWIGEHGGTVRAIGDLPYYRYATFEPMDGRSSLIDREFQQMFIEEQMRIREWADRQ